MDISVQTPSVPAQPGLRAEAVSKEAVRRLAAQGRLETLYLIPLEFGGAAAEVNIVYVPAGVVEEKSRFDAQVRELAAQGEITYQAMPEYNDESFIPSQIELEVSGSEWLYHVIDVEAYL